MGCHSCSSSTNYSNYTPSGERTLGSCRFTLEMMLSWRDMIMCIKDTDSLVKLGLTKSKINSMLGVVMSGINLEYNICFLQKELEDVELYITKIISLGIC